jgi:hypothetical protein
MQNWPPSEGRRHETDDNHMQTEHLYDQLVLLILDCADPCLLYTSSLPQLVQDLGFVVSCEQTTLIV